MDLNASQAKCYMPPDSTAHVESPHVQKVLEATERTAECVISVRRVLLKEILPFHVQIMQKCEEYFLAKGEPRIASFAQLTRDWYDAEDDEQLTSMVCENMARVLLGDYQRKRGVKTEVKR